MNAVFLYFRCTYLTHHIPFPRSLLNRREFQSSLWEAYYSNPCNCDPTAAQPQRSQVSAAATNSQETYRTSRNGGHHQHHHHHPQQGHQQHHHGRRNRRDVGDTGPSSRAKLPRHCSREDGLCKVLKSSRKLFRRQFRRRHGLSAP